MRGEAVSESGAELHAQRGADGTLSLALAGRLDARTTGGIWRRTEKIIRETGPSPIHLDASALEYCDVSGVGYIGTYFGKINH